MTQLIKSISEIQNELKNSTKPIGLVPTMGALHEGHISLMKSCKEECKTSIVYIFVNPLQFAPSEDFERYPRDINHDFNKCRDLGVDYVFAPDASEIYPDLNKAKEFLIHPPQHLNSILCAKTRPNHFEGVATVIKVFLDIIKPDKIYFGKKDLQQVYVVKWLINECNLNINLKECPTIRGENGLALSSRNNYLTEKQLELACALYQSLKLAKENMKTGFFTPGKAILESLIFLSKYPEIKVEYFEARDKDNLAEVNEFKRKDFYFLVAAKIGDVRLIDNIEV